LFDDGPPPTGPSLLHEFRFFEVLFPKEIWKRKVTESTLRLFFEEIEKPDIDHLKKQGGAGGVFFPGVFSVNPNIAE